MGKVLHASFSGYFPTCIIDGIPTPSQDYLSLTLEQAMALFWRVKTWEAKATGSFQDPSLSANIIFTSSSFADMTPSITIEQEEDFVCKGNETFNFDREGATATLDFGEGGEFFVTGNITFQHIFSSIKRDGSTYYPKFYISFINALTSPSFFYSAKIGTYKITYLEYVIEGDLFGPNGSAGSALIEINAREYWSYGGTYNTSTG